MGKRTYTEELNLKLDGGLGTIRVRLLASQGAGKSTMARLLYALFQGENGLDEARFCADLIRKTASRIRVETAVDE